MTLSTAGRPSRRWRAFGLGVALLLVVASACGGTPDAGAGSTTNGAPAGSATEGSTEVSVAGSEPEDGKKNLIDAALEEAFGYSLNDIGWASERAAGELLADCMISRGWDYERSVPERFDPSLIERTTAAEQARVELEVWEAAAQSDEEEEEPPEYSNDEAECWQNAAEEVPNPVSSAWSWLDAQTEGLYERVSSDPRVVDAKIREQKCIAETGYESGAALDEMSEAFEFRTREIKDAVRSGERDMDDALEELDEMADEHRLMWEMTDPCIEARLEVTGTVADELEAEWLEEHGDQLAIAVAEWEDDLDRLRDQLAAITAES